MILERGRSPADRVHVIPGNPAEAGRLANRAPRSSYACRRMCADDTSRGLSLLISGSVGPLRAHGPLLPRGRRADLDDSAAAGRDRSAGRDGPRARLSPAPKARSPAGLAFDRWCRAYRGLRRGAGWTWRAIWRPARCRHPRPCRRRPGDRAAGCRPSAWRWTAGTGFTAEPVPAGAWSTVGWKRARRKFRWGQFAVDVVADCGRRSCSPTVGAGHRGRRRGPAARPRLVRRAARPG